MDTRPAFCALLLGTLLLAPLARAQAPPSGGQPDLTIDAALRRAVIDTLCDRVDRYYVFPDRAKIATKAIRKRYNAHEYDRITSAQEFADSLTAHMQAAVPDLHLRAHYRHEPIPVDMGEDQPDSAEAAHEAEFNRRMNYGFEKMERMPGNVGYLDLRGFSGDPAGQATAVAAMNFLSNTDALIIDLRRNGGGHPKMIATILTYFTKPEDRLLINRFYHRENNETNEYWTSPYVPGPRYAGKPIYVLISNRTGSAAEEFAYDVQTHKLGTVVGAVSAGGANPGGIYRLSANFAAFIATGRAINPVTKTNWEGAGVQPDSVTTGGVALRTAYTMALEKIIVNLRNEPDRLEAMQQTLADAAKRTPDPEEDFVRPKRRAGGK
jgi:hypothetical protein